MSQISNNSGRIQTSIQSQGGGHTNDIEQRHEIPSALQNAQPGAG